MENEKIKKVNPLYLLAYIWLPLMIAGVVIGVSVKLISNSGVGTIVNAVAFLGVIFWYAIGGEKFYKSLVKKIEAKLDAEGFKRNQTFYGKSQTVIVDIAGGRIASVFFWNPFKYYITSASKIEKAWVDDGKRGSGFTEGSQRVRFCFTFEGNRMNIDTFISNQRLKMTDKRILDGISKADLMVETLNRAKANAIQAGKV